MAVEKTRAVEVAGQEKGGKRAGHRDIAVGEVDQAQHAVDHRITERYEGVDAADGQPEHEEIEPMGGGIGALDQRAERAADDYHDHADTESPQRDLYERDPVQAAEHA